MSPAAPPRKSTRTASHAPSIELAERLQRAQEALVSGDLGTADAHMAAAADLCRRMQEAGLGVPAEEIEGLRDVARRCGEAIARAGQTLNAESLRDDNHRRGINAYLATLTR